MFCSVFRPFDPWKQFVLKANCTKRSRARGLMTKSQKGKSHIASYQGHTHLGIPNQRVPIAEAFVRYSSEQIEATLVETAIDERHRVAVGKTVLTRRNHQLGFMSRINQVAREVKIGMLSTVCLPRAQRNQIG